MAHPDHKSFNLFTYLAPPLETSTQSTAWWRDISGPDQGGAEDRNSAVDLLKLSTLTHPCSPSFPCVQPLSASSPRW